MSASWLPGPSFPGFAKDNDRLTSVIRVDPDLLWFSGHFPARPILPGVALLFFIQEVINKAWSGSGQRLGIRQLKRIRFRHLVEPGAELSVSVWSRPSAGPDNFGFVVETDGEKVCDGYFAADTVRD
ncbi:MAG: hypothetical protein KJ621_00180 [Proteobacteria bacterium]|nr:hypothetical protein [Pseudomonadota bacterium]MBU1741540.1 hypothetical protein [Pseudomonadota bacterium]